MSPNPKTAGIVPSRLQDAAERREPQALQQQEILSRYTRRESYEGFAKAAEQNKKRKAGDDRYRRSPKTWA